MSQYIVFLYRDTLNGWIKSSAFNNLNECFEFLRETKGDQYIITKPIEVELKEK